MTDNHVHIGNFYEAEYDFRDIFTALKNNGTDKCVCAYLTPEFEKQPDAVAFSRAAAQEIKEADAFAKQLGLSVDFLYWAVPDVLRAVPLSEEYAQFPYKGIVIHPFLGDWKGEADCLTEIFEFAERSKVKLYFHTGVSERDEPLQFEKWFAQFPEVEVQLAHCKDEKPIIELFKKYRNLTGGTAFCPADSYRAICKAGFKERMKFGTDFPVTHYWEHKRTEDWENDAHILTEQYARAVKENAFFTEGGE